MATFFTPFWSLLMESTPILVLFVGRASAKESKPLVEALAKKYELHAVTSGKTAQSSAAATQPRVIIVDAATLRTTGERVCKTLRAAAPNAVIFRLIPTGEVAASACVDVTLTQPITPRKLLAQVKKHLTDAHEQVLTVGPLTLNLDRRILIAWGRETVLNPKIAELFAIFLKHPNHVLDRAMLMRAVWDTDYVEDTRTLNVHISYARQILEAHGHPRLIQTVRGIGYRLDIPL